MANVLGRNLVSHLHDNTTHVVPTVGTNDMRRQCVAAFRTNRQLSRLLSIVRTTLSGTGIRVLSLRYGHRIALSAIP